VEQAGLEAPGVVGVDVPEEVMEWAPESLEERKVAVDGDGCDSTWDCGYVEEVVVVLVLDAAMADKRSGSV
jgi:hypothetical protein